MITLPHTSHSMNQFRNNNCWVRLGSFFSQVSAQETPGQCKVCRLGLSCVLPYIPETTCSMFLDTLRNPYKIVADIIHFLLFAIELFSNVNNIFTCINIIIVTHNRLRFVTKHYLSVWIHANLLSSRLQQLLVASAPYGTSYG